MAIIVDAKIKDQTAFAAIRSLQSSMEAVKKSTSDVNAGIHKLNISLANTKFLANEVATAFQKMVASIGGMQGIKIPKISSGGSSGGSGGGRRGSGGGSGYNGPLNLPIYSNLRKAYGALHDARVAGDPYATKIAQQQVNTAYNNLIKKSSPKAPPVVDPIRKLINNSRAAIGPNGKLQLMPIFGHMLSMGMNPTIGGILNLAGSASAAGGTAGLAGTAAGVAAPFAAAAAQSLALAMAMKSTVSTLNEVRTSLVRGGGTVGEARSANLFGAALGIDVAGLGSNLLSGFGPIAAAGAGVNPLGGPFGDNNYNTKGLKVLDWIRNSKDLNQSRKRAEMAGSPDAAGAYFLSQPVYDVMRNQRQGSGSFENMRAAADFSASMAVAAQGIKDFIVILFGNDMKQFAYFISTLNTAIKTTSEWLSDTFGPTLKTVGRMFQTLGDAIQKFVIGGYDLLVKPIIDPFIQAGQLILSFVSRIYGNILSAVNNIVDNIRTALHLPLDSHKEAVEKNTDAVNRLNNAVREGQFGGGPRASSSMPGKVIPGLTPGWQSASWGIL